MSLCKSSHSLTVLIISTVWITDNTYRQWT